VIQVQRCQRKPGIAVGPAHDRIQQVPEIQHIDPLTSYDCAAFFVGAKNHCHYRTSEVHLKRTKRD
jgi:hypothetical protein